MNRIINFAIAAYGWVTSRYAWAKENPRGAVVVVVLILLLALSWTTRASHENSGADLQGVVVPTPYGNRDYYLGTVLVRTDEDANGKVDYITFCMQPMNELKDTVCLEVKNPQWNETCRFTTVNDGFYMCGEAAKEYVPNAQGA